ncbi:MAG: DNA methyltransferase [bacterium]
MDANFLEQITAWRETLAQNIAIRNNELNVEELNEAVQKIIVRLIFIRLLLLRDIEPENLLLDKTKNSDDIYKNLIPIFRNLDNVCNGLMFKKHFSEELIIDNQTIKDIIINLCSPPSEIHFDVSEPEILGRIYEKFLSSRILITENRQIKIDEKSEVRKAGGIFYTPEYIVDYIVENTVGKQIEGLTPEEIKKIKIIDPSCGAGSFLLGAYSYLIDYHKRWYTVHKTEKTYHDDFCVTDGGEIKVTLDKCAEVLKNNIFGVDIDRSATEVAIMSLYLKMLGYSDKNYSKSKSYLLPDMTNNIKCGNSLIGLDFFNGNIDSLSDEYIKINPFDWEKEFPEVFQNGGFDCAVGNPPYIDSEEMVKSNIQLRNYCSGRYDTAKGNWDIYCVFCEKSISLLKTGRMFGFIIPNKFLSASYGVYLREYFSNFQIEKVADYSSVPVFASNNKRISVYPIVAIIKKQKNNSEGLYQKFIKKEFVELGFEKVINIEKGEINWTQQFDLSELLVKKITNLSSTISQHFVIENSASVSEAYKIKELIKDNENINEDSLLLVNTGTIDRYSALWGIKKTQYIKETYQYPQISKQELQSILPKRYASAIKTKLVLAGMVKKLEAFYDNGSFYSAKSTTIILTKNENYNLKYLLGLINSKLYSFIYVIMNKYNAMSGGYLNVSKKQLENFIFREIDFANSSEKRSHDRLVSLVDIMLETQNERLNSQSLSQKASLEKKINMLDKQIDRLVYKLYDLSDEEIKIVEGLCLIPIYS